MLIQRKSRIHLSLRSIGNEDDLQIMKVNGETHIKNGTNEDNQGRNDDKSRKGVEGQNLEMEVSTDHSNTRRSKRLNAGKTPVRNGYKMVIRNIAPQAADDDDLSASYWDDINRVDDTAWIEAMKFDLELLKKLNTWELIPLPKDRKVIRIKWAYVQKKTAKEW